MNKIKQFLINLYNNTYKLKSFRDILWFTRLVMFLMLSLIIAFITNLYICILITQDVYIITLVISCIFTYFLAYKIVAREYQNYKKVYIKNKYPLIYIAIESIVVAILFVFLFLYIQSKYI